MFQQYQNGVRPVTGLAEAGANIGQMYMRGIGQMAEGLTQGIKAYNENSAKNELANAKIQSLSQDVANKIAMYSKDPEIAQSGVLDGLMQTAATLQEAPTKGLNQRIGIAHEAETRMAGFGQQLQEWSFLRGREIERGISDALKQFAGTVTDTKSIDVNHPLFDVNPNETITQTKDRVYKTLEDVKKLNPNTSINNDEFWARWLSKAEQEVAKSQDIDPKIISAQLESIQAEKNIQKQNRLAQGMTQTDIPSGDALEQYAALAQPQMNTVKDYEAMMSTPAEAPAKAKAEYDKLTSEMEDYYGLSSGTQKQVSSIAAGAAKQATQEEKGKLAGYDIQLSALKRMRSMIEKGALPWEFERGGVEAKNYNPQNIPSFFEDVGERTERAIFGSTPQSRLAEKRNKYMWGDEGMKPLPEVEKMTLEERKALAKQIQSGAIKFGEKEDKTLTSLISESKIQAQTLLGKGTDKERADALAFLNKQIQQAENSVKTIGSKKTDENELAKRFETSIKEGKPLEKSAEKPKIPTIGVGDVTVGYEERTRPVSVSERKSQVQDFLTQRFGAIDPTDPTGKRRIPVQGFDQFFAKAVPESEVKEFTTDSGIRLLQINGKWEQVKAPERQSIQDIRKERIGVFGQQTADGRLVPTEFVPDSGIYLGGLYRGTDAGADKFTEEITQLIDARRGVKRLQEINDKFGEAFSLKDSGEAAVEVMNLKAALRTDIIGVGTVSNFEQALIDKVIKDPTEFLSMEPRDRAILLALANRIDRRIKNISSSRGLTVQIKDTGSTASRYDDIRQRYLREKGLL